MNAREALNKAARLVEDEAIAFDEDAEELASVLGDECPENRDDSAAVDSSRGRAAGRSKKHYPKGWRCPPVTADLRKSP